MREQGEREGSRGLLPFSSLLSPPVPSSPHCTGLVTCDDLAWQTFQEEVAIKASLRGASFTLVDITCEVTAAGQRPLDEVPRWCPAIVPPRLPFRVAAPLTPRRLMLSMGI
ncbi:hypothetical protein E2C01_043916 [Portunus trituberculatus]|uniref:Uncharacterized protein n=1 Tax=Portunus trituberculatus TaxID=210409 RepID=A0A5B7FXN5_PORTR|nr:hypothetical protein [Portunus trituberculatus]